ncbi:unnamed protein product [Didymodactylos carnosus]|uniref:NAD(P)(+)--arginine ADP-ribosyltransferase n=1 Tax=Didymodactylos carnosus TaxID=1234261 RepID=A0A814Q9E5_9BILA|nr:unnamed protein product [Didymodactylos carnosus]CAF3879988.1 unnamed protein product [Didymodactylos carnosus]
MDYNVILNKLRSIVNYIQIFDQSDECVDYVKSVKNEKIFIIVSDMLAEQLIDRVHNEPQLDSIYVFCSDSTAIVEHELWTKQYGKVRNVYNDIDPLCKQMKWDTKVCSNDFMGHASFDPNINIARGGIFNNQEPSFMYLQLIKEILIDMEHMEENKQEFIEFCREQYKDNTYEFSIINEFEQEYLPKNAIWWYTRDCFLYRMLNKALRTLDINIIYKMRFYIKDLHLQLHSESLEGYSKIVYRGESMSTEEFETKLKRYVGGLISMNYFMLTSIDKKVALDFARARQKQLSESVLYRIELDSRIRSQQCPFADVEKRSYFEKEKEILISFGSVFRIRKVQRLSDGMWIVYLIFTGAEDQQLKVVTNQIRKEIQSSNEMIRLAKLMMQMGQFEKAEQFYNTLVSDVLLQKRYRCLSLIYNDLGLIFMQKKEHQKALAHFDMSLRILKKHVPKGDQSFATRYNNIGSVWGSSTKDVCR